MRLSMPVAAIAAAFFAVVLANPVSAEPSDHATTAEIEDSAAPSALAGPQGDDQVQDDDQVTSQPKPVYPDGEPDIDTVESDDADEAVEPSEPIVVASVDKETQEMTVFVDGVETYAWPVSTGLGAGYATPSGTFTTSSMNKIWYSRQWDNAPMPHAVFFTKRGHAVHGTDEVKNLGKPASHGCIRLSQKNAETFYNLVKEKGLENTQVVLTGVTPGGEYKVAHPPPRARPDYDDRRRYRWYDRYGYYEEAPPVQQRPRRRRFFQPYYDSPPAQQEQPRRRRGWFFRR